jgi:CheY-like chemotaxis protein
MTTTEKKVTALIIEDEAPVALSLQDRLQRMGYRVCGVAFSGEEALKLVERYQPDVILTDINLIGEMDGVEVISEVRNTARTPVVYISAYPSDIVLDRLLATEPYEYLVKPIRDRALRNALTAALAQR